MNTRASLSTSIPSIPPAQTGSLQRKCAQCSDKDKLLQRRAVNHTEISDVPPIVHEVLNSPGQPLDIQTRTFMEPRFGHDFSHVRVHTDTKAAASAQAVNALAYTVGQNVVFGAGQYGPHTRAGQQLLAHELTHVVQQRAQPSTLQPALKIQPAGDAAEQEADRMAEQVVSGNPLPPVQQQAHGANIQRRVASPTTGLTLDIVAADAPEVDPFLVRGAQAAIGADLSVTSLEDMIDQLEQQAQGSRCVRRLRIWHHGRPGLQRVGTETSSGGFTLNWLLNARNQDNLNRLRRVFCCDGVMHWLGCATAGVSAPGGARTDREQQKSSQRFDKFADVYQTLDQAAARGADQFRATLGSLNIQAWANGTCTTVIGATDFVIHDASSRTLYRVGYGGEFLRFPPSDADRCSCDPATGRIAADDRAPSPEETVRLLAQPCNTDQQDKLERAAPIAETLVNTAVLGLQDLLSRWGTAPTSVAQDAAAMGLRRAFNIEFDKTLWVNPLGMDPAEVQAIDARDRSATQTILANFQHIQTDLQNYLSLPSCTEHSTPGTPCIACMPPQYPRCQPRQEGRVIAFVQSIGSPSSGIFMCPGFFQDNDFERAATLIHELSHLQQFAASDAMGSSRYYGCPAVPLSVLAPGLREPAQFIRIASSYDCFVKTQHDYTGYSALAATTARPLRSLPADDLNVWAILSLTGDMEGALRVVVQAMERAGEIDPRLLTTQSNSSRSGCRETEPFVLDSSVNGANTISCGCFGPTGNRLPNPRIRIHPDLVSRSGIGANAPLQLGAETLQSTILHEFRHVRQDYEQCNLRDARSSGVCTDCNDPTEMDAYLAEIEAGYAAEPIRHAWVRVYVNWDYLSDFQQAAFIARRQAAEQKVRRYFPGANWNTDSAVSTYRNWCQGLAGGSRGTCDATLAPTGP